MDLGADGGVESALPSRGPDVVGRTGDACQGGRGRVALSAACAKRRCALGYALHQGRGRGWGLRLAEAASLSSRAGDRRGEARPASPCAEGALWLSGVHRRQPTVLLVASHW